MEEKKIIIDRAILVGLNADCFTPEETSQLLKSKGESE